MDAFRHIAKIADGVAVGFRRARFACVFAAVCAIAVSLHGDRIARAQNVQITNAPPPGQVSVELREVPLSVLLETLSEQGVFTGYVILPGVATSDPIVSIRYNGSNAGLLRVVRKLAALYGLRAYLDVGGTLIIYPAPREVKADPRTPSGGGYTDPKLGNE